MVSGDGSSGQRYSTTRFLHGLLWFVTGFSLSCALSYMSSYNVSKFVLKSDIGNAQYEVKHLDGQSAGQRTRVFLFESETEEGKQQAAQKANQAFQQQQQHQPQNPYIASSQANIDPASSAKTDINYNNSNGNILNNVSSETVQEQSTRVMERSPSDAELEELLVLDKELKRGIDEIGFEIVDDEMLLDVTKENTNAYPRYNTVWDSMDRQSCFLFIAVLTSSDKLQAREALRDAWVSAANLMEDVVVRFVMMENERSIHVEQEVKEYDDIIFVPKQDRRNRYDLHKVYQVFEFVAEHFQTSFLSKTDDAAFVNVPVLAKYLRSQCRNDDCLHERLYLGYEKSDSPVMRDASQSEFKDWINQKYYEVVKNDVYIPYMMGGGYILSGDLIEIIVSMHRNVGLLWTPIEDATVGLWLAGLNVRRVSNQHSFLTQDFDCCFYEFPDMPWHPWIGYNRLVVDVCKTDVPRLILHSIRNSTFMKTLGWRVRKCDFSTLLSA